MQVLIPIDRDWIQRFSAAALVRSQPGPLASAQVRHGFDRIFRPRARYAPNVHGKPGVSGRTGSALVNAALLGSLDFVVLRQVVACTGTPGSGARARCRVCRAARAAAAHARATSRETIGVAASPGARGVEANCALMPSTQRRQRSVSWQSLVCRCPRVTSTPSWAPLQRKSPGAATRM